MTALTTKFESVIGKESKYPLLDQGVDGGKIKCLKDKITFDYDFQSGDEFTSFLVIPENAYVVGASLLGPAKTTGIFSLGDGTTVDAFVKDCNLDALATRFKEMDAENSALFQRVSEDTGVVLTCSENATAAEGDGTAIDIAIYYVLD